MFSSLTELLVEAAHDLDLVRFERRLVVQFEVDIGELEGPDIVAEAVRIKMTLPLVKHYIKDLTMLHTLNDSRDLTLSAIISVNALSKLEIIFIAS